MRALLSFIVSTTSFGLSLWAGVAAAAEPFNWNPQVDDPIHTPAELVESMHSAFGYNHCRAVQAKGIILQGEFTPDTHAKEITKAPHLQGPGSKVTVRFSDFSGVPTIPDNDPTANPRGVASGPCAATPTALDRFLEFHPTARAFLATQETPASFATISYYGVGSFKFINAKGESQYVRYQLVPEAGEQLLTDDERKKQSANYLMDEIKARVAAGPIGFALYAQVAEHGDKINDPSIAWPDNRKRVLLGRLEIKRLTANTAEEDRTLVFNPSNVPTGIETADVLSSFYSKAFRLSAKEERGVASVAGN